MEENLNEKIYIQLKRIADSLDKTSTANKIEKKIDINANCFIWDAKSYSLQPVENFTYIDISLLKGVEYQSKVLLNNTINFKNNLSANNVLLWGSRGTGKSSLVKSIFAKVLKNSSNDICLIEIHKEELNTLSDLLSLLKRIDKKFIIFCDDLSFEKQDKSFKSLKTLLDGSIEAKPKNIIFYATSNRRHLIDRNLEKNNSFISETETMDENVSLSDRFGIWLGFHSIDQITYLKIIESYALFFKLNNSNFDINKDALEWAVQRGSRSGRVAWQYIMHLAAKMEKKLNL